MHNIIVAFFSLVCTQSSWASAPLDPTASHQGWGEDSTLQLRPEEVCVVTDYHEPLTLDTCVALAKELEEQYMRFTALTTSTTTKDNIAGLPLFNKAAWKDSISGGGGQGGGGLMDDEEEESDDEEGEGEEGDGDKAGQQQGEDEAEEEWADGPWKPGKFLEQLAEDPSMPSSSSNSRSASQKKTKRRSSLLLSSLPAYHRLLPCLNRHYACEHGYSFFMPSSPKLALVRC
jgi:hypothetical protein